MIPTDTLQINEPQETRPVQDLIQEALQARPEIATARINFTNAEISRKALKNALRPTLDVYAFYGASALAGDQTSLLPPCDFGSDSGRELFESGNHPCAIGYPNAFHNLFNSTGPDKGIGVNLNIVLRNRARAVRTGALRVGIPAVSGWLATDREQHHHRSTAGPVFRAAELRRSAGGHSGPRLCQKESLTAEQKKFGYGASTPTLVLQASSNLTTAESNVLNAAANYEKSKVQLDKSTAETLSKLGIDIADAESGQVKHARRCKRCGAGKCARVDFADPAVCAAARHGQRAHSPQWQPQNPASAPPRQQ